MAAFLVKRQREAEWMDAADADPALLQSSLRFIRSINSCLQYTRATLHHLRELTGSSKPGETLRILDVATGSGDVPEAIVRWAKQRGVNVEVVGIDLHHQTLLEAKTSVERSGKSDNAGAEVIGGGGLRAGPSRAGEDRRFEKKCIRFVRADATCLPFADGGFDYVLSSMFLHHLDEPVVIAVLREMNRVASRGVIVADLLRSRRAYFWIWLFTILSNPMVKHDARVSVSGALTESELLLCRDAAGLSYLKPYRHFGHRLVLAGTKG